MSFKKQLKSFFKKNKLNIDIRTFKRIEFVLYVLHKALGEFELDSANLYFTQYYRIYCNDNNSLFYLLRKKYHHYYSKKRFNLDIDEYNEVPEDSRLFVIQKDKVAYNSSMKFLRDRDNEYERLIERFFINNNKKTEFISNKGYYERAIRYGEGYDERYKTEIWKFDIGNVDVPSIKQLPAYRKKQKSSLSLDFNWDNYKRSLGNGWENRPSIKISSCNEDVNKIDYDGVVHIAGLLGAGKSTFIIQETTRLLKSNNIKIGIVVSNVTEVLKFYEALIDLNIKVVPIIGSSQLYKHRDKYMNSKLVNANSFQDVIKNELGPLDYLTPYCKLSHYAKDYDIKPADYPCCKVKNEGVNVNICCPLIKDCGYFKKYTDLIETDVWVTTAHSLLSSRCNNIVDPLRRTYYELFHDYLDIIFIDEADSIQEDFDNHFMTDEVFYGSRNSIMRKFQRIESLLKNHNMSNIESETHRWIVNYSHLQQLMNRIEYLIVNSPAYRKLLIQDTLTPRSLYFSLINSLKDKEAEDSRSFIGNIESFLPLSEELKLNETLMSHDLYMLYDRLTKCPNVGNANKMIDSFINSYVNKYRLNFKESKRVDVENLFKKRFELFIYIVLTDYYFRIQNNIINNLAKKINEISSNYSSFKFYDKDFMHFVSESVIGNVFGYKLCLNDTNKLLINIFSYSGVGRSLIENWDCIKSELNIKGPSVVMLSGTSYAPASAHFHLEQMPTYILKSEKCEGSIEQFVKFKYKNAKPIKISGVSNKFIKQENLLELTSKLINDIKVELSYWRSKGKNRNVLLIVNSYDQCRIIGDCLKNKNFSYKVLSNKSHLSKDEINTSQIEAVSHNGNVDILVAPLSIISRGYNIIDSSGNSYFGSAFFLIRPYISPDDLAYNYRVLNSVISPLMSEFIAKGFSLKETFSIVRKFSFGLVNSFNEKKYWRHLSDKQRQVLSWYTFIPIKQAVGRMQRNGCSCRVFYCDFSFVNQLSELTSEFSMLKAWHENLNNINSGIGNLLYGQFYKGLSNAIKNYSETFEEEQY